MNEEKAPYLVENGNTKRNEARTPLIRGALMTLQWSVAQFIQQRFHVAHATQ